MLCELKLLKDTVTKTELVNTCLYIKKIPGGIPVGSVVKEKKFDAPSSDPIVPDDNCDSELPFSTGNSEKSFLPAI